MMNPQQPAHVSDQEIDQLVAHAMEFISHTQPKIFRLAEQVKLHPAALQLALLLQAQMCELPDQESHPCQPYFEAVKLLDRSAILKHILSLTAANHPTFTEGSIAPFKKEMPE